MKNKLKLSVLFLLLFVSSISAQKGFRIELGIGPTIGDSREDFSYTLQGNFYYLWNVSTSIDVGATTGGLVFLGDGETSDPSNLFSDIPDVYIPLAIVGRIKLSKVFSTGLDMGYGFIANGGEGGLYFRPIIAYNLKEKLAFTASYVSISENGYTASTINLGVNFGI